jgi:hypothetical protein
MVAYRVTKEEDTEPYGKAYQLNLEEMFNDYMSESPQEERSRQESNRKRSSRTEEVLRQERPMPNVI